MTYIIAFVIIIVAAGALLLFQAPAEAPVLTPETEPAAQTETKTVLPEGYTPPTEQPPTLNPGGEDTVETEAVSGTDDEINQEIVPEAVAAPNETYVATASYLTPKRTEHDIEITLELEGKTIIDANVTYDGDTAKTPSHSAFDGVYTTVVLGKNINQIELSRVGGASLTSDAFNEAVADIRAQL